MGGIGSGRWGGGPTIESTGALVLDINQITRSVAGQQRAAVAISGSIGRQPYAIGLAIDLADNGAGTMRVQHANIRHASADTGPQDYPVALTATPCRFGGRRWWFVCPKTAERVGKLYLPNGGRLFLSRLAYGLGYRSQRIAPAERIHASLARLHGKLGAEYRGLTPGFPPRPKGMRQRRISAS